MPNKIILDVAIYMVIHNLIHHSLYEIKHYKLSVAEMTRHKLVNSGLDNRIVDNRSVATYESNIIQSNIIIELSLHSITSSITRYYLIVNFIGTTSTFIPMHFLGFNVMPRRIPDFPDY